VTIRTIFVAAILTGFSYHSALADTATIIGIGANKCSNWTAARAKNQSLEYQAWVFGAFSGAATSHSGNLLKDTNGNSLLAAVDQECQLRPESIINDAVVRIVNRLAGL
jgi:hypothetical protein